MMNLKRIFLALIVFLGIGAPSLKAQVDDVSLIVSPYISYNWWNENIALNNSLFYGTRVGFGFGPFFEIKANLEKSTSLEEHLKNKSWNKLSEETLKKLSGMPIEITRAGGELKVNLLDNYFLAPYLLTGVGVQVMDYTPLTSKNILKEASEKEKQLYYTFGAGLKFSLAKRLSIGIEGRNIRFKLDKTNPYVNSTYKESAEKKGNWQANAVLDFYFGGGNHPSHTPEGKHYKNLYTDGFRGAKFVIEPGIQYIDFKEDMPLEDRWLIGGSIGVDFSSLLGLRAFYYQGTKEPQKLALDLDSNYKMYGLNMLARLNQPRGIIPYLQFGAGYIDQKDLSLTKNNKALKETFDAHNLFGLVGAGIELPISRWIALYGLSMG